jgi:hypothetical protein
MFHSFESSRSHVGKSGPLSVIVFETQEATPHLETTLEIVQRHLDEGDQVTLCFWSATLPYGEPWGPFHDSDIKGTAFKRGLEVLDKRNGTLTVVDEISTKEIRQLPHQDFPNANRIEHSEELRHLTWMGLDAGEAALSSLITRVRLPSFPLEPYRDTANAALRTFCLSYLGSKSILAQKHFDIAYVFNGRFCATRGILRALNEANCDVRVHERASSNEKFALYTAPVHHRSYFQDCVKSFWAASIHTPAQRNELGSRFFKDRANGQSKDWPSFTAHQDKKHCSIDRKNIKLVSYFSSSDDEQLAAGDAFQQYGYPTQDGAVHDLCEIVKNSNDLHLIIRVHPHLRIKPEASWKYLCKHVDSPNIELIPPDSQINSYSLLESSDLVLSYGSTVGVEATFHRKPSAILGSSYYDELEVTNKLFNRERLHDFFEGRDWTPNPIDGAIMYGYFWAEHGIEYQYYKPVDFFSGTFRGINLFEDTVYHASEPSLTATTTLSSRFKALLKRLTK